MRVPLRVFYKYILILMLLLSAAFLTPQLLPRWLGFQWASPEDLCVASDYKIDSLQADLQQLTRVQEANAFLEKQKKALQCMEESAKIFYHGKDQQPPRFQWPDECDSQKAKTSLEEKTCVKQEGNICSTVGGFAGFFVSLAGQCRKQIGEEVCLNTNDGNRTKALLELERERERIRLSNETKQEHEDITATANSKVQKMIATLVLQADIASDAFILYSIISIAVGVPLVVYKREKGSRIVGATFGMTKMTFVMVFIIVLSLYDSAVLIFRETDFPRLFHNFLNDPCYVDPRFSSSRVAMIVDVCNNVTLVQQESEYVLQKMDAIFYDTRLFGFCKDDTRKLSVHPHLEAMDSLRKQYRSGDFEFPGQCNATELNEKTSVAPTSQNVSKMKAFLGSGVVAQLLLKFIVTSFLIHLIAFIEPMVLHNGKVEVWGARADAKLGEREQQAVTRFARDKHLLPLLIFGALMLTEVILIIYSITTTISGNDQILLQVGNPPVPRPLTELSCPASLMPS